jgi:DNA-binding MarR family transcriptional regulator
MTHAALTLDAFLPFRLSYTSNLVSEAVAQSYRALFGISIPEWRLIAVIAENSSGITQQAIGAKTRMDKVTVSRAAIALHERGLIARAANPGDRRSHLLALTAAGQGLYAEVAPLALSLEQRLFAGFDATEMDSFVRMLRQIDAVVLAKAADSGEFDAQPG